MTLAAFDTGSRFTGWCVGGGTELPTCGAWSFPPAGNDLGAMLMHLHVNIERLLQGQEGPVQAMVFEKPILNPKRDKLLTIRKLYALAAHVEFIANDHGIPCNEVDLHAVKKELAGFAQADKSDMVAAALKIGMELPTGPGREDAADAFGAWLLLLRSRSPTLSARFDSALWGSRGALI